MHFPSVHTLLHSKSQHVSFSCHCFPLVEWLQRGVLEHLEGGWLQHFLHFYSHTKPLPNHDNTTNFSSICLSCQFAWPDWSLREAPGAASKFPPVQAAVWNCSLPTVELFIIFWVILELIMVFE